MWLWILATLLAFFVKGLCGFANALVFSAVIGFGAPNVNISPVEICLSFPSNVIMTWKTRRNLKARIYVPLVLLVLAGSIPGAFFLKNVDAQILKVFFGVVVVLIGVEMLLREYSSLQLKESKILLVVIGIISGAMCGLFGIGALLAAYVSRVTRSGDEFKANINAVFVFENIFRIILYAAIGVINLTSLKQTATLFPFMLIGLFAGMKSSSYLDDKLVKKIVISFLILSGIILVVKNI